MNNFQKFFGHLRTVNKHRRYVRKYCFMARLYWRGLTHDLSKYSPVEFWESVKYYQGNRSPIDACKEKNGFSKAWQHHRGRNKHHREAWTDYYDMGTACVPMPYTYAAEMLCDYLGAGKAYQGAAFTYDSELRWWENQLEKNICIHPMTAKFITLVLTDLTEIGGYNKNDKRILKNLQLYYEKAYEWYWYLMRGKGNAVYFGRSLDFKNQIKEKYYRELQEL